SRVGHRQQHQHQRWGASHSHLHWQHHHSYRPFTVMADAATSGFDGVCSVGRCPMKAGALMELKDNLKTLKLSTMAASMEGFVRQAKETGIGYEEFLLNLTVAELQGRSESRLARRIREAKFPLIKPLETFDLAAVPELDLRLFRELTGESYIKEHRNVIFLGKTGRGKTHMSTALGIEACKNNFRT